MALSYFSFHSSIFVEPNHYGERIVIGLSENWLTSSAKYILELANTDTIQARILIYITASILTALPMSFVFFSLFINFFPKARNG